MPGAPVAASLEPALLGPHAGRRLPVRDHRFVRRWRSDRAQHARTGFLFCLPALAYFVIWIFIPAVYGIWVSLNNYTFISPSSFVGLKNFTGLPSYPGWTTSLWVTVVYVLETVVPTLFVAFVIARLLLHVRRGRGIFLAIFFVPFVIPAAAAAIIFELLLQPAGIVNHLLGTAISWLTQPAPALGAVSAVTLWSLAGYYVIIFLAGMQQVPLEVIEAAHVDGATLLQRVLRVELPLLKPTVLFSTVTGLAYVLTSFTVPFVMTSGGPGSATTVLPLLIYRVAFQYGQGGSAEAMAIVLFGASVLLVWLQFALLREKR